MPADMYFDRLPLTVPSIISPYGDNWDLLWLGHCGTSYPNMSIQSTLAASKDQPKGRVVHLDDPTVPENQHLIFLSKDDDPRLLYPPHTRTVHHVMGSICSLGYAVTQSGARRILYEMGIKSFDEPYNLMLRSFCERPSGHKSCITVQPQLFNHHRPAGNATTYSDISDHGADLIEEASTEMIRWSARMNIEKLLNGDTAFDDQFPDSL